MNITGTRIIYDRKFLLLMRNSPLSKTPPAKLATIPDIINEDAGAPPEKTMSPEPAVANREGNWDLLIMSNSRREGSWGNSIGSALNVSLCVPLFVAAIT